MASSPRLPPPLLETLRYFDKYDYPLTKKELVYWQSPTTHPFTSPLFIKERGQRGEFYYLLGRQKIVSLRQQREKISLKKWQIAKTVGERLKRVPGVLAVFVTGALAMNNCPADDDIDLMIVTAPNTLWITRFFVNLFLATARRYPGQTSAPNKICPNLWLDTHNLHIKTHDLYQAHEILQAKCIFDRGGVHYQFLKQNSWVKKYLPIAYKSQIKNLGQLEIRSIRSINLLWLVNLLFFIVQWLYMLPKMTSEKVGLGYAFFHPNS